jgi:hypothetical protein
MTTTQTYPTSWTPAKWAGLLGAAIASFVVTGIGAALTIFSYQTTCGNAATSADMAAGQRALAILALCAIAPWAFVAYRSRHRRRLGVAGAVGVSPTLIALVFAFDPETWVGSWCF